MGQEFGDAYGHYLADKHALHALGDRTASQALDAGESARRVWAAICDDFEVPAGRRFLLDPRSTR